MRNSRIVALAAAWYALLLRAYPAGFRRRFGRQMTEVFEDRCRAAHRQRGRLAVALLCAAAVGEVAVNAVKERSTAFRSPSPARAPIHRRSSGQLTESAMHDAKFAFRTLAKSPGFTFVTIVTLALGIGANTAIFSVVNGVLLKPLPYDHPEDLVAVGHTAPGLGYSRLPQTAATFLTYREESRVFEALAAWNPRSVSVTGTAEPEWVDAVWVTEDIFAALRVWPVLGSAFTNETISERKVILSHGYWQRRFGGDPGVIGKTIRINLTSFEIIGVMPEGFRFLHLEPSLYLPNYIPPDAGTIRSFDYRAIGRLRAGATLEDASRDIARMIPLTVEGFTWATRGDLEEWRLGPDVHSLKQNVVGDVGTVLWILFGTFGLVLLIACANVANLFLVRAEARQREVAVRTALGATRGRVARQFLVESVMLGCLGGVVGLGLALAGVRLLVRLAPSNLPRLGEVTLDPAVLVFTAGISVVAGLVFGLVPVLHHGSPNLVMSLKEGGHGAGDGVSRHRMRTGLAMAEVALALVLLIGSGLMIRSFQALRAVDPGFDRPEQLLTMRLSIHPRQFLPDPAGAVPITEQILQRLSQIPGATAVGATTGLPLEGATHSNVIHVEGVPAERDATPITRYYKMVAGDYFATMGIPLLAGRAITWDDIRQRRPVGVVTENIAREFWGDPSGALGRRIRHHPNDAWREIVGVVGNVYDRGLDREPPSIMYWPMAVEQFVGFPLWVRRSMVYVIRTTHPNPRGLLPQVRQAIWSVNPDLPLANVRTLDEVITQSLARTSFTLLMLSIAAAVAVMLGTVGIYGVISYAVAQRTREIGVRIALGAGHGDVHRMVLRHGALVAAAGVGLGLATAAGTTRAMAALLFGVTPADPMTYGAATISVGAIALLASYLPARRAASIDPVEALRLE